MIILFLCVGLINQTITIGSFAAILASIDRMFVMVRSLIVSNLGAISKDLGTVRFFINFISDEHVLKKAVDFKEYDNIELKHVFFKYPDNDNYTLKNISITLKAHESIAIVGRNGSGKSTLAKLILGIYPPTQGMISYGCYQSKDAYIVPQNTSAVFQDFNRYKLTLRDNINISLCTQNLFLNGTANDKKILEILNSLDVDLSQLGLDLNSNLSIEYGGKELSGGIWQRIAIARGILRDHCLIVLDEPTASIDPIEETKIFNIYKNMSQDKLSIIISHRIGIAKLADRIIVMKDGEVVGNGNHAELLRDNSEYKLLWESQAKFYEN